MEYCPIRLSNAVKRGDITLASVVSDKKIPTIIRFNVAKIIQNIKCQPAPTSSHPDQLKEFTLPQLAAILGVRADHAYSILLSLWAQKLNIRTLYTRIANHPNEEGVFASRLLIDERGLDIIRRWWKASPATRQRWLSGMEKGKSTSTLLEP